MSFLPTAAIEASCGAGKIWGRRHRALQPSAGVARTEPDYLTNPPRYRGQRDGLPTIGRCPAATEVPLLIRHALRRTALPILLLASLWFVRFSSVVGLRRCAPSPLAGR